MQRKIDVSFLRQVIIAVVAIGACSAYPLMKLGDAEITFAVAVGALMSVANVVVGYAAIEFSFDTSYTKFLQVVLGGMGIRMLVLLAVLGILIGLVRLHALALVGSMLVLYTIFLVLEIFYIQRKMEEKNKVTH